MKKTVHWLCWQPTPYNNFLFRSLTAKSNLELIVHFIEPVVASHPWRSVAPVGFEWRVFKKVLGVDWHLVRLALFHRSAFFVIAGWHDTTMQLVISILGMRKRPYAIWTDTPDNAKQRPKIRGRLRGAWLRWVFRRAMRVLGTGSSGLQALAAIGCPEDRLVNFPYVVDLDQYTPGSQVRSGSPIRLISSGRASIEMKGHDVAIAALARAHEATGKSNFEYLIAGTGPDLDRLREQVERDGLGDYVKFLGWLEPEAMTDLYKHSHVLIHPSRYEPFGVAVLEAMAAGLPVLGSDACGAVIDRVRHGHNGFIHRAGDIEQLSGQIATLLTQPELIEQLGLHARQTAESWPVQRLTTIVENLATQNG